MRTTKQTTIDPVPFGVPEGFEAMNLAHAATDAKIFLNPTLLGSIAKASLRDHDGDTESLAFHAGRVVEQINDVLVNSGETTETQVIALVAALGYMGHDLKGQALSWAEEGKNISEIANAATR